MFRRLFIYIFLHIYNGWFLSNLRLKERGKAREQTSCTGEGVDTAGRAGVLMHRAGKERWHRGGGAAQKEGRRHGTGWGVDAACRAEASMERGGVVQEKEH